MLKQNYFIELILTLVLFIPIWINLLEIKVATSVPPWLESRAQPPGRVLLSACLGLAVHAEMGFLSVGGWRL